MSHHASPSLRRTLRRSVVLLAAVAAATTAVVVTRSDDQQAVVAPASIFKIATVEAGTLGTSERIDGSVVLSEVTDVLHRIEGQTSSTPSAAGPTAGLTLSAVSSSAVSSCSPPTGSTVAAPPGGATSTTVGTGDGTNSTTPPSDPGPPSSDSTPTTQPASPTTSPTTSTVPCDVTTTTMAGGPGGAPSGGPGTGTSGTGGSTVGTARVTEVITSVIATGAGVGPGVVLYSVESSPVVAMAGALPAWRTLSTGSDDGRDIAQLELSLVALGYDPDGTMTVDDHFDSDTRAVVRAWQAGYGIEVTGEVALGSVVFLPQQATVSSVQAAVGDAVGDGDRILSLAASNQQVVIDVPAGAEAYLVPGLVVKLGSTDGTVSLLRSIERNGEVVVQAVITPTAELEGMPDGSAVTVTVTVASLDGVLLVPAEALVSRIDGNYALQVVQADGSSSFVPVELLGISGATAAVRGDGVGEGTEVLQPR
ncbi:MAG: peptidoglycan-binding domain-containing protein [Actinomycetota bacterium]|nr:peptidoglycan-binding domain-containing protein [Actinomycetota bacterium]